MSRRHRPSGRPRHTPSPHVVQASQPDPSADLEALVVTRSVDTGEGSTPYSATVRFRGHRVGAHQPLGPEDQFVQDERLERITPGTGLMSVTATIYGRRPGDWIVDAELIGETPTARRRAHILKAAAWSWRRWALSVSEPGPVATRWSLTAPLARIPAVVPGSYPVLAAVGIMIALAVQALLAGREGIDVASTTIVSAVALVFGLVAAKVWYRILHPNESLLTGGWAVDGFLVVAPIVAVAGLAILDEPVGAVLDATAPGLFFAVAIGRVGCFLTGCCAGRTSPSRWAIWSSDRRVGARRIPAQLIESAVGLVLGLTALIMVIGLTLPVHGLVFVTTSAGYAAARQGLLRLRAEVRRSTRTLPATAAAAAAVLLAVGGVSLAQPDHMPPFARETAAEIHVDLAEFAPAIAGGYRASPAYIAS